jgi:hypothetical protein
MTLLLQHVELNKTHGILICPVHECVVLPNSVRKHFDKNHCKDLTSSERTQMQAEADELLLSVSLKTDYSQFQFANQDGSPLEEIPYLGLHPSMICNICEHICSKKSAKRNMKEHLRIHHRISVSSEVRGVSTFSQHARSAFCQRYFIGVTREAEGLNILRYFEVMPLTATDAAACVDRNDPVNEVSTARVPSATHGSERPQPTESDENTLSRQHLQLQLEKATTWAQEQRKERLATVPHDQHVQTNPWLAYTRFLEILPPRWEDALEYMAIPPREQEPALYFLHNIVKGMVRTWQNSTAKTSRYARIRVMQENISDVPLLPLEVYQNFDLKHALPLQKTFVFFYRVLVQGLPAPKQLCLSPSQRDAWARIAEKIEDMAGTYTEVEVSYTRTHLEPLEQLCHMFWLALVEQTCLEDEHELALVVSTAYLVVSNKNRGIREGYNFATDISALKKIVRLASMQKFKEQFVAPVRRPDIRETNHAVIHLEALSLMSEQMIVA